MKNLSMVSIDKIPVLLDCDIMSVPSPPAVRHDVPGRVEFVVLSGEGDSRTYGVEIEKLTSASRVFKEMFKKLLPNNHCVITISDTSPGAFKVMLRHIFGLPFVLDNWELCMEVYCLAETYDILSLQRFCDEYFTRTAITSSSALEVFKLSLKYNVTSVQSACEEFFERDSGDVLLQPNFLFAEKNIVKKIVHHKAHLPEKHILALIEWAKQECRRQGLVKNPANVEKLLISVCGTNLAIQISKVIRRNSAKKAKLAGSKTVEKSSPQEVQDVTVQLQDSASGTMMSAFNTDVICDVKIQVLQGVLEFTGIGLRLKPSSSPRESPMEIFYSLENIGEDIGGFDVKVDDGTFDECKVITFSQGLIVKPGQCGVVTVTMEDLKLNRCMQLSEADQSVVDESEDVHFVLSFTSNQTASKSRCSPFCIEKLFYKTLKYTR